MPLHIDRNAINVRPYAHEHVHDRAAQGAKDGGAGAAAAETADPTASAAVVVDPSVTLAVRAASTVEVGDVDAAERLVASLRGSGNALSGLNDALDPARVQGLLQGS
jgi:hypothetical protein